ncbi:MAG: type I DNA topoisomerase [Johnsonella sp.]|nr:type I DNA topoisomerase [Johnsonella sp.]
MANNLVIVESPAKVKTIKKYLGPSYEVRASNGHVRDLPKSSLGIDVENDFEPKYITIRGKGDILSKLRKDVKKADKIYLATDPDREGEAISWHLIKALKLDEMNKKAYRISFNEITKNAIKEAIKHPRKIDMNLVDAQQARRVLDRIVGYKISPLLWGKIKRGLSAGRVQSVALRMICERDAEVEAFLPKEYWSLEAALLPKKTKKAVYVKFYGREKKEEIENKKSCDQIMEEVRDKDFIVEKIAEGERVRKSLPPFITSTLQQEASKQLNFSTQKTMKLAQQLYEGLDLKEMGTIALITYLRTDSTRVSDEAEKAVRGYIREQYGENYVSENIAEKKSASSVQDAHEAIRPTDVNLIPIKIKDSLSRDQFRLYQLIWKRFVASRMAAAVYDTKNVRVRAGEYLFTLSGSHLRFEGFLKVYNDKEEKEESDMGLVDLREKDVLKLKELKSEQHFTQPPPHYTEASLVKALEEQGIGRPSTYAPTITTILARHYIVKEKKNLYATELGQVVNSMMVSHFTSIVDRNFTANLELLLDGVGEGRINWKTVIENFYPDLNTAVKKAEEELESVKIADEETDIICENCGKNMVIKYGPHGKFLACPGFPECRNTKVYYEKVGVKCPKCEGEILLKKTKKGRIYYGCEKNPECDFMSWQKPVNKKCKICASHMVEKGNNAVCSSPGCGYSEIKED